MSRIKLSVIALLVLAFGGCSQPKAPEPGLGSPPPLACDVQALYAAVDAANITPDPTGTTVIALQAGCSYALTGKALEVVADSEIEVSGNGATIDAQGDSRGIINRGKLSLINLTVTGGHATKEGDDGKGGGIWNSGDLGLVGATVSANSADVLGGGVYNVGGLTLSSTSSISGNTADIGGGVGNEGTLTMNDASSISGNTSFHRGGGVNNTGSVTLHNTSNISGNIAVQGNDGEGGGVFNESTGVFSMMDMTTISGNTAFLGGGVFNIGLSKILTENGTATIHNNTASAEGGGVWNEPDSGILWVANFGGSYPIFDNTPDQVGGKIDD